MAVDWWSFGAPISKGFLQAALLGLQQQQAVQAQQRDYADWVQRTLYRYQLEAPEREAAARRAQLAESAARINLLAERAQSDPKNQTLLAALNQAYQEANLPGLPTQTIPGPVLQPAMRLPMGVARAEGVNRAIPEVRGPATQQFTTYTPPRSPAEIRQQRLDYQAFLRQKVYAYVTDPKSVDWPTLKQQMREAGMIPTAELQQAREAYRAANRPIAEVETPRNEYDRLTAEINALAPREPELTPLEARTLAALRARHAVLARRLRIQPPTTTPPPVGKTITWDELGTLARANGTDVETQRQQAVARGYTITGTPSRYVSPTGMNPPLVQVQMDRPLWESRVNLPPSLASAEGAVVRAARAGSPFPEEVTRGLSARAIEHLRAVYRANLRRPRP